MHLIPFETCMHLSLHVMVTLQTRCIISVCLGWFHTVKLTPAFAFIVRKQGDKSEEIWA